MSKRSEHVLPSQDLNYNDFVVFSGNKIDSPRHNLKEFGVVLLDKHSHVNSHALAYNVKELTGSSKVGHSGTLDPAATGLMLITLGRACKLVPMFNGLGKEYIGHMHLHGDVSDMEVREAFKKFVGEIKQTPPKRSAVKRVERARKIFYFDMLKKIRRDVEFVVGCEAGTYIRTLCVDVGEKLGVGAHLIGLRRTKIGPLDVKDAVTYDEFEKKPEAYIREPETVLGHVPKAYVKRGFTGAVLNGAPVRENWLIKVSRDMKKGDRVAVFLEDGELVAMARSNSDARNLDGKGTSKILKISSVLGSKNL